MKTLILSFFIIILFAGCKKTYVGSYQGYVGPYQGILTGYNMRACASPACGGMYITIKNDPSANPPSYYLINSTKQQLGIPEITPFPINVTLDYKPETGVYGTFNYIIVTKIAVVN
jgi:hypothetical protein